MLHFEFGLSVIEGSFVELRICEGTLECVQLNLLPQRSLIPTTTLRTPTALLMPEVRPRIGYDAIQTSAAVQMDMRVTMQS
jgi:hypothetical protein